MIYYQSCNPDRISQRTYRVSTDVEVEGSDLLVDLLVLLAKGCTMGSPTLSMIENGRMAAQTTGGMKRTDTLSMGVVVEDAGEDVGHDDGRVDGEVPVKVGELTNPMAGVISEDRIPIKIPVGTSIRSLE